ncbi:MAG: hypothetical protein ACI9VR_000165 [Cognaticolwellia sp.]|jgi:hypothetical protein
MLLLLLACQPFDPAPNDPTPACETVTSTPVAFEDASYTGTSPATLMTEHGIVEDLEPSWTPDLGADWATLSFIPMDPPTAAWRTRQSTQDDPSACPDHLVITQRTLIETWGLVEIRSDLLITQQDQATTALSYSSTRDLVMEPIQWADLEEEFGDSLSEGVFRFEQDGSQLRFTLSGVSVSSVQELATGTAPLPE